MSLFADYLKERLGYETYEVESGFISYWQNGDTVWIQEFYVAPEVRGTSLAKRLADTVCKIARERGATKVRGIVRVGTGCADHTLKTNLHYGMRVISADAGSIVMEKEL